MFVFSGGGFSHCFFFMLIKEKDMVKLGEGDCVGVYLWKRKLRAEFCGKLI